jgi:ABC-type sulfate transport system permease component
MLTPLTGLILSLVFRPWCVDMIDAIVKRKLKARSSNDLLGVMMGYALFAMVWVVRETDDAIIAMDPPTKWAAVF